MGHRTEQIRILSFVGCQRIIDEFGSFVRLQLHSVPQCVRADDQLPVTVERYVGSENRSSRRQRLLGFFALCSRPKARSDE